MPLPVHSPPAAPEGAADALAWQHLRARLDTLCEQGAVREALPLAWQLFAHDSDDLRSAYLLGACLQRLGQPSLALGVFLHCAQAEHGHATPGPLLRAGECLAALERPREAIDLFEAAVDASRTDARHASLQHQARLKADLLRASA
jgi:tetratricopeptide (TPR) repeat protein